MSPRASTNTAYQARPGLGHGSAVWGVGSEGTAPATSLSGLADFTDLPTFAERVRVIR
jgi:hypothetical protein